MSLTRVFHSQHLSILNMFAFKNSFFVLQLLCAGSPDFPLKWQLSLSLTNYSKFLIYIIKNYVILSAFAKV